MNTKKVLLNATAAGALTLTSQGALVADAAADYVDNTAPPTGWAYVSGNGSALGSGAITTTPLTPGGTSAAGNPGFNGSSTASTPWVVGDVTGTNAFQIFTDGASGDLGSSILVHPGNSPTLDVILQYTLSTADLSYGTTAIVSGYFRDLQGNTGGGGASSVDVYVFYNNTMLFNATGSAGRLSEVDGTFSEAVSGVVAGGVFSFVADYNGSLGGDETAVKAQISVVPEPSLSVALISCLGIVGLFARRRS